MKRAAALLLAVSILAACGDSTPAPEAPDEPDTPPPTPRASVEERTMDPEHAPTPFSAAAQAWVVNAFADAPVDNPDGLTGITLHIVLDDDKVLSRHRPGNLPTYNNAVAWRMIPHPDGRRAIGRGLCRSIHRRHSTRNRHLGGWKRVG